ncbi:hypothetical protein N0V90_001661 [Kalmusia sp. IMI 367209]|nr:hypothetical protein N0V90_001661 [Kalmusia sp. IMI 367209]
MSGFAQKRGGGFDHYNNGRSQKHARSGNPKQTPSGPRGGGHPNANNRRPMDNSQPRAQHRPQAKRADEHAFIEHINRLPDPRECEPCKLAAAETESGMIALLNKLEAEETRPDGDRDVLRHARELRQLLGTRSSKRHINRTNELDRKRPVESKHVMVPAYIEQKIELAKDLPPLPPILEPSLQEQVFTHMSVKGQRNGGIINTDALTYEPLEFIGDAYLELFATRLIASRLPHVSVPEQSHFREQLVRNDTLSRFSNAYCLPDRLKHMAHLKESGSWSKITADVFEAYVAGVILSDPQHGFATAEKWMTQLWAQQMLDYKEPIIDNPAAKDDLTRLIHMRGVKLEYREEREMVHENGMQKFFIGVYLTGWGYEGECLGSGEGRNKTQASVYAAADALNRNSDVLKSAASQKQGFMKHEKAKRDEKREMLRNQAAEGDEEAIVELKELIAYDINIKKRDADRGDEYAAAELEKLITEEAQLAEKARAITRTAEGAKSQDGASHAKKNKVSSNSELYDDAEMKASTTPTKEPKKKKKSKPEDSEAGKPDAKSQKDTEKSNNEWLENLAAGKVDMKATKENKNDGNSWLEKERKKKEKKEKKRAM